jgi:hypothetical protein
MVSHYFHFIVQRAHIQNVSIQNVYTHNVSLAKHLLNRTSPITKRLLNITSPHYRNKYPHQDTIRAMVAIDKRNLIDFFGRFLHI